MYFNLLLLNCKFSAVCDSIFNYADPNPTVTRIILSVGWKKYLEILEYFWGIFTKRNEPDDFENATKCWEVEGWVWRLDGRRKAFTLWGGTGNFFG